MNIAASWRAKTPSIPCTFWEPDPEGVPEVMVQ